MLITTFMPRKIHKAVIFSLLSLSSFTIVSPSFAASLDLSSWGRSGDVIAVPSKVTLTNAFADGSDDAYNYNVSSNDSTYINSLETFLGLNSGDLGFDATEGSAIKKTFNILAGDVISFDYSFLTYDTFSSDRAFVTISNSVIPLTGNSSFSYTFANSGNYNVGIGVIDVIDNIGSSKLTVTNTVYQTVPEPSTILGSILAGCFGVMLKRK
ncbi:PEP-CTERM putative exosortase interaction domain-containing protein (plasmid) [Cylindrospermum stagnale PCC 7417]|uniref:PEP-CTERM putative exosortase interaction domain-containing protein n=1 Tax=Cylindrospermum stagnale PCC 7417 TaxID=56107 RepID=K9X9I2_9NOST|nr:PEP-CTERM sorting domain-containing protein [Cylindrospermum stagnale]AFZ28322.1 PEP-CTERM putative exosortase interaction domain-containing protein [Cylindrospermum stagnale PCC 7417]